MHESVLRFVMANLFPHEVKGKRILEVGSMNVNGSVRPWVESLQPLSYHGVDIAPGPGVDEVHNVSLGIKGVFDVVISTEMLEHAEEWQAALMNMFEAARETLILTCRGPGFPYHNPPDFWRFRCDDLARAVPEDFVATQIIQDPQVRGVFLKAVRRGYCLEVEGAPEATR